MDQSAISEDEALEALEIYRNDPAGFVHDVLGANLWDKQMEICGDVFKYRETAVKTCNAVGKSYIAGRTALAFLLLIPGSLVVTTAPTWRQVKDILWRELGTAYKASKFPLGGRLTQTGLEFDKDWYAIGLSTNDPEKFFGYHADWVLVVIDEAAGVEEDIFRGVRAITPNENAHILYIGNPTSGDGTFKNAFTNPRVRQHTISAFDSPNLMANNIRDLDTLVKLMTPPEGVAPIDHNPKFELPYPSLISPTVVFERFVEWGTDSPMWQSLIMGEFPAQAENTLIPLNLIQQAADNDYRKEHAWPIIDGPLGYGVDVARFGSDRTVLAPTRGDYVDPLIVYTKQDTNVTAERVIASINPEAFNCRLKIDDTGLGGGVTDTLRARLNEHNKNFPDDPAWRYQVVPINFGSGSTKPEKFYNLRAEMFWHLRERFINHRIAIPNDQELINELASIRYEYTGKQQIKIEAKDEIKKRTGKSPDKADALALAFAKSNFGTFGKQEVIKSEDKPYFSLDSKQAERGATIFTGLMSSSGKKKVF